MRANSSGSSRATMTQKVGLVLGPVFGLLIFFSDLEPGNPAATRMAAVAALMATWWITEALPLSATALLPLVLFPMLGIMKGKETAPVYINSTIFLFIGGFMIGLTMQRWHLHKRIALWIIRLIGSSPSRIVLGFMVAAAFLSMWISNTATAIMMVPMALAVILRLEERLGTEHTHHFTVALLLGIAYACSVGGIATLVGTPPNLSFVRIFEITFPNAAPIAFGQWLLMTFPLTLCMLALIWLLLTRVFFRFPGELVIDNDVINKEHASLGRITFEEKAVLTVFLLTAFLWVFRQDLHLGLVTLPGWSRLIPFPKMVDDATVAVGMALLLFLIPTRSRGVEARTLMGVEVFRDIPWNIVLLFGGGFALASGFQISGLSSLIGSQFAGLASVPPPLAIAATCGCLTFLTELTSNTATTEMILPVLAAVSVALRINPLLLMIPATLSASCAFMMPVATPPNAIVFGSGRVRIIEMVKVGLVLNLIGVVLITVIFFTVGSAVFAIDPLVFPDWASATATAAESW